MTSTTKVKAPAKVNLNLHVTGKRDDGMHLLESVITFADIADEIEVSAADYLTLKTDGPFSSELNEKENLLLITAQKLCENYNISQGVDISLTKNIPVEAGLGGGSADVAAVIPLLCKMWNIEIKVEEMHEFGGSIGADVPVCQYGRPAFVTGIGENIEPIDNLPEFSALLVNPGITLATAEVFGKGVPSYSESHNGLPSKEKEWLQFLKSTTNDLEENATSLVVEIEDVLTALKECEGITIARMSGSGATCFGIFDGLKQAQNAQQKISTENQKWWVRATKLKGS